jgi:hypothetical protein
VEPKGCYVGVPGVDPWDSPALRDQIRITVADWLERGDIVQRVERFEGDPPPDFICSPGEACECRS